MIRLTLPLPPSPNEWPSHHMAEHRAKRKYQREAWLAAVQQSKPPRHPPKRVKIAVTLYVYRERDEDGITGSLKWLLDALRQKQRGNLRWREGIADRCGYFIDDDPSHLELVSADQETVGLNEQRVEITITERQP